MTNQEFNIIADDQINMCLNLLIAKDKEYNNAQIDRFHTFEVAAKLLNCTKKQALAGMMIKHTVSIYDMCRDGNWTEEQWTEKITDSINYLLLLKAMVVEDNHKNDVL